MAHNKRKILAAISLLLAGSGIVVVLFAGGGSKITDRAAHILAALPKEFSGRGESFAYGYTPFPQDPDIFQAAKEKLIKERKSFIEADLSAMVIRVYRDGEKKFEAPILSKGREGSWWETPAGIYTVQGKEKNHFSRFGRVYMPWSIPFEGNFFIHGWPYYPDGREVPQGYSGGCIRLSTPAAKQVFALAEKGMPVIVYKQDFHADTFQYEPRPHLSAESYLLADLKSNYIFARKDIEEPLPIASLTKLLTAAVAVEYLNIEKELPVSREMLVATSVPRLKEGKKYSLYALLFPLLMESSNEAAMVIEHYFGKSWFLYLMERKANAIGMRNAVFQDAAGISGGNRASAMDLLHLAKYLLYNRSFLLNISRGGVRHSAYGPPPFPDLKNFNHFSVQGEFLGGKVGKSSAAKEAALAIFSLLLNGKERPVAIIVLRSPDAYGDVARAAQWLQQMYGN